MGRGLDQRPRSPEEGHRVLWGSPGGLSVGGSHLTGEDSASAPSGWHRGLGVTCGHGWSPPGPIKPQLPWVPMRGHPLASAED